MTKKQKDLKIVPDLRIKSKVPKVFVVDSNPTIQRMFAQRDWDIVEKGYAGLADLVVWGGGADVHPSLYNEKVLPRTSVMPHADHRDIKAWHFCKNKPKVGICRGAQFLNVMNGGALWQHVDNHATGEHDAIDLVITKNALKVTSTHHQMMRPSPEGTVLCIATEAKNFHTASQDTKKPEFDTEVVWYEDSMSLCFQPHPEFRNKGPNPNETEQYFFDLLDQIFF